MQLTHTFTVSSDVAATWAHVMDLHAVGGCFPGATVTSFTGEEFAGTVKVKLGPIALLYAGSGRFVDRDDAAHVAVIEARGKDARGNGTAGATVSLRLAEAAGGGTRAEIVTDLAVTGKPAQFGRGVMQDVSDKLLGQFVACLEQQLAGGFDDLPADSAAAEAADADAAGATDAAGAADTTGATDTTEATDTTGAGNAAETTQATETTGGPATTAAPTARAVPPGPAARVGLGTASRPAYRPPDDAVDLGAAVLPVLAKTYGPYLLAGLAGLAIGLAFRRRPNR